MKNKKSQEISINTIIIAAVGLAILVVLFAIIFTGRLNIFPKCSEKKDYDAGKLAQRCEDFCASINLTCVQFSARGCHDVKPNLTKFRCQRVIKNPVFDYYVG